MKCPYLTTVIHVPEDTEGYMKIYAKDITEFCECVKDECPFYYISRLRIEHCKRAEREG